MGERKTISDVQNEINRVYKRSFQRGDSQRTIAKQQSEILLHRPRSSNERLILMHRLYKEEWATQTFWQTLLEIWAERGPTAIEPICAVSQQEVEFLIRILRPFLTDFEFCSAFLFWLDSPLGFSQVNTEQYNSVYSEVKSYYEQLINARTQTTD